MQKALSYRTWPPSPNATAAASGGSTSLDSEIQAQVGVGTISGDDSVAKLVSENAMIVFGRRGCCMCHVVKQLLLGLGVNPTIFFVDEDDEAATIDELSKINGGAGGNSDGKVQFPAVFVGGKLFGGLERVMATHITGELVPILRQAGALWL